jgi:hypothetical protein
LYYPAVNVFDRRSDVLQLLEQLLSLSAFFFLIADGGNNCGDASSRCANHVEVSRNSLSFASLSAILYVDTCYGVII